MPNLFKLKDHRSILSQIQRGIEREAIRIDATGQFARDPHPPVLGSALTHAHITTDYSEALIELITDPHTDVEQLFQQLQEVHSFVQQSVPEQSLWGQSMPCHLPAEVDIPIAEYGISNSGKLRHVYREGLAVRYGKKMQCIAGLHYNFSLPESLWTALDFEGDTAQEKQNNGYMALIRNFKRYSWLLMYLFGASPAVNASFLDEKPKAMLTPLEGVDNTYHLPYATSLRMSDLGYKNDAQSNLKSCFNELGSFAQQIYGAVTTSWPAYEKIGVKKDDKWIQLNTNILQIENEFYATIRPKRTHGRGERPITALIKNGIQYIEVRCIDIDPFEPLGIAPATARFLDAFLLFCAVTDSPKFPSGMCQESEANFNLVVNEGRRPGLTLQQQGKEISLKEWGLDLIAQIRPYAEMLDAEYTGDDYIQALAQQEAKLKDIALCPSQRVIELLTQQNQNFNDSFLALSRAHSQHNQNYALDAATRSNFQQQSAESLAKQKQIEQEDNISFEQYLHNFMQALSLKP